MTDTTIDGVLRRVKEEKVQFVQLWFTDLLGNLKSIEIPASAVDIALVEGIGFDGSSIHGFARIDESDMVARPDAETFAVLPWDRTVARVICDVLRPGESRTKGTPVGS